MGTRADFYIREDGNLRWLGSVGYDGYDVDEMTEEHASTNERNASCWAIRHATATADFLAAVERYFALRNDVTKPEQGWPWPWEDSCRTDRAYVFDGDGMKRYAWGKEIIATSDDDEREGPQPEGGWPNMKDVQNVTVGTNRSGIMLFSGN
jgi:hypothetical protein